MKSTLSAETSKNKGEWSELYTFIKLLYEGRIFAADENLEPLSSSDFLPIIKIRREEEVGDIYDYHTGNDKCQYVKIYHNELFITKIPVEEFRIQTALLYKDLSSPGTGNLKLSEMNGLQKFLQRIFINKITADNTHKADIIMEFLDVYTGFKLLSGFSIKSQLGAASTLLNASKATNFIFQINGIDDDLMNQANNIATRSKIMDRMELLKNSSEGFSFVGVDNEVFADNLEMIDSRMAEIMSFVLLYRYRDNIKSTPEIIQRLCSENPLYYHNNRIYEYKYKKLLAAVALGMMPSKYWNGRDEANGGYVIVKKNGDVLAYYLYNRNAFEDYLLKTTFLEAASTTRHEYASVYKKDGKYYIKLNLQIRFKA